MGKILSQDEIDSLLTSARQVERESRHRESRETASAPLGDATVYNFRRPDRVSKEQIRSLHFLHDRFARNMATSLSAFLRAATDVTIVSVEQFTYSEFLMSLPDPTAFYAIALPPQDGMGALELNPSIAFAMIDRMLGGSGRSAALSRALTEIEQHVIDSVVKLILENLTDAWRPIVDVEFRIHARETRPQMLQVTAPNEAVILLVFDFKVADARGMLNICVPATVGSCFSQGWHGSQREPGPAERHQLAENLRRVRLPITVEVAAVFEARELLALKPGDVLSLGHPISAPLDVRAGRVTKFRGQPTRTENAVGVVVDECIIRKAIAAD